MQSKLAVEHLQIAQETLKHAEKAVADVKDRESQLEKEKEILRREVNEFQMRYSMEQQKSKEISERIKQLDEREYALEERARIMEAKELEQQRRYNRMETQLKRYYEGIKKLEQKLRQKHQILVEKEKEIDEFERDLEQQRHALFQQVQNRLHELEIKETTMTKTMDAIRQRERELFNMKPVTSPQKLSMFSKPAISSSAIPTSTDPNLFSSNVYGTNQVLKSMEKPSTKSSPPPNSKPLVSAVSPISELRTSKAPSSTAKALFQTPKISLHNETDTETETTQDFNAFRQTFRKEPIFQFIPKKESTPVSTPKEFNPVNISSNGSNDNFNLLSALGLSPESPSSFMKENLQSQSPIKSATPSQQEVTTEGWIMDDTEFGGLVEQLELENAQTENTEADEPEIKIESDHQEMEIINSLKSQNSKLTEKIKKIKAELEHAQPEQANAMKSILKEHEKTIQSNISLIEQLRSRT